jgi:type IV pilus assembly protein PilQ
MSGIKNFYLAVIIIGSTILAQENTKEDESKSYDLDIKMSINMKDSDIRNVLGLIGELTGLNIVITPDVQDTVTADLENVSVRAALDAILEPNGYSYFIRENIIIIKQAGTRMIGELVTEIVKLKYIDATGLSAPLKSVFSDQGNLTPFSPLSGVGGGNAANIIIITDVQDNMKRIKSMIERLDVPIPNINIAVKFIETQLDTQKGSGGLDWTVQPIQWGSVLADSITSGLTNIPFRMNNVTIATLNPTQLLNTLRIMEARGNSKLLSSPSVTTLDNHAATTNVTTSVYIQGNVNSYGRGRSNVGQGATSGSNRSFNNPAPTTGTGTNIYQGDMNTVTERHIGINLSVTPRLNGINQITLRVDASVEALLASAEVESDAPRSTTRSVQTQVTVSDGDTVILGGLIAENMIENTKYVPILSGLPVIGRLFRTTSIETEQRELLIFITPNVVG